MKKNNNILTYKGYYGSIEYDLESKMLYGKLLGIKGAYIYEGRTLDELETDFKQFVDDYLYDCQQEGIKPEKPNIGSFNIRIGVDLHIKASEKAKKIGQSLNSFVKQAIEHELESLK
ncbi:MAG: type II toxin-antitoxin system HicB family antitoxin [Tannerella sp.]|jgi:predicted HicB family RNase H-like nuclease|nr:type II toxin-antitoxin system HicB family antitoxin [Tannerella sp.]